MQPHDLQTCLLHPQDLQSFLLETTFVQYILLLLCLVMHTALYILALFNFFNFLSSHSLTHICHLKSHKWNHLLFFKHTDSFFHASAQLVLFYLEFRLSPVLNCFGLINNNHSFKIHWSVYFRDEHFPICQNTDCFNLIE